MDERPRGVRNDEMSQCLQDIINENCMVTITTINSELQRRLLEKSKVHARTIAKHLEGIK